jgi:hypothetical protein
MKIALVIRSKVPALKYGGTERVVTWLSDALVKLGHQVMIYAQFGSRSSCAKVSRIPRNDKVKLPNDVDIVHFHSFPTFDVGAIPSVTTMHCVLSSTRDIDFKFPKNTLFLSKSHSGGYDSKNYVYNGLNPDEYIYKKEKDDYFLFMGKIKRSSKGVDQAIELAKRMGFKLIIAGGWNFTLNKKIRFVGDVGGRRKAQLLANAKGFLFPIRWPEPFGLVSIEAMVSGTPVIATPCGAVTEIVNSETGFLCKDIKEMEAAVERIGEIKPEVCRQRVLDNFTSEIMARNYLQYYTRIIEDGPLKWEKPGRALM